MPTNIRSCVLSNSPSGSVEKKLMECTLCCTCGLYTSMRHMTMQAINFTTARNELASVLYSVSSGEPIIITRRSAKPVVVIDAEQYEKC
ncbi:type II toxin-antitoxin system Phd/YefM family antitoxin [Rahnella variigena]|uniref:type II toxin-antitoxin system Phd/YefM family antitoxin n=1 Tax=Rahnella variigena TaxID=574964 RepID=UPI00286DF7F1|nr:type II toxin-antitoxin system Phd/YefM family antitoxin [Rahnella variigena]